MENLVPQNSVTIQIGSRATGKTVFTKSFIYSSKIRRILIIDICNEYLHIQKLVDKDWLYDTKQSGWKRVVFKDIKLSNLQKEVYNLAYDFRGGLIVIDCIDFINLSTEFYFLFSTLRTHNKTFLINTHSIKILLNPKIQNSDINVIFRKNPERLLFNFSIGLLNCLGVDLEKIIAIKVLSNQFNKPYIYNAQHNKISELKKVYIPKYTWVNSPKVKAELQINFAERYLNLTENVIKQLREDVKNGNVYYVLHKMNLIEQQKQFLK